MKIDLKEQESQKREKLRLNKPQAYAKVCNFSEKIKKGESIAILQFQFDYNCNFNCGHCSVAFRANRNRRELLVKDVEGIAKQADELGLARWVFTGGEPLFSQKLEPFIKAIDPAKWYISCDSNGWFLNDKRAAGLKMIGIDRIQLSIDSLNAIEHDAFRKKPGSHARCMQAIGAILKADLDIFIQTVVTKQRLHSKEFIEFLDYFTARDIDVFVTFAKPVGNYEGCFEGMIDQGDLDYFRILETKYRVFNHLKAAFGLNLGCPAVKNMLTITAYGDVLGCQYVPISIGNLLEEPLRDILARGKTIKWFNDFLPSCPPAMDKEFIKRTYGKEFPIKWCEFFTSSELG